MSKFEQPGQGFSKGLRKQTGKEPWHDTRGRSLEEQLVDKGWIVVTTIAKNERLSKKIQILNVGEGVGVLVYDPSRAEVLSFDAEQTSNHTREDLLRDGWDHVRGRYMEVFVRSKQNTL